MSAFIQDSGGGQQLFSSEPYTPTWLLFWQESFNILCSTIYYSGITTSILYARNLERTKLEICHSSVLSPVLIQHPSSAVKAKNSLEDMDISLNSHIRIRHHMFDGVCSVGRYICSIQNDRAVYLYDVRHHDITCREKV